MGIQIMQSSMLEIEVVGPSPHIVWLNVKKWVCWAAAKASHNFTLTTLDINDPAP